MAMVRRLAISLLVGAMFGWAMSAKFPIYPALLASAAAAVVMAGWLVRLDQAERREPARPARDDDAQNG